MFNLVVQLQAIFSRTEARCVQTEIIPNEVADSMSKGLFKKRVSDDQCIFHLVLSSLEWHAQSRSGRDDDAPIAAFTMALSRLNRDQIKEVDKQIIH